MPKAGQFRWIDGRGGHSKPGPGRSLYRLAFGSYGHPGGGRFDRHYYEFVGARARFCDPCAAVVGRRKTDPAMTCPMCGSPTKPTQLKEE